MSSGDGIQLLILILLLLMSAFFSSAETALTTVNFTLGSEREEYDLTELALSGPVEFVAVAIEDAATPAVWALEAIELTGLPGEPVP